MSGSERRVAVREGRGGGVHESHRLKAVICCRWSALISGRRPLLLIPGEVAAAALVAGVVHVRGIGPCELMDDWREGSTQGGAVFFPLSLPLNTSFRLLYEKGVRGAVWIRRLP